LGPLARHLLRPGHLLVAGRAGQGSRALVGPVQLQEPAVRQDRLLPPVHDRGLEAAGRATGPAGRRASQEAAGVLQPALGVQPEPGGDPGAAGRFGPAAGTGRPALVAAAPGAGTPAQGVPAPASPSRPRPQPSPSPGPVASRPAPGPAPAPAAAPPAGPPGGSLPAPPPLSAPLGMAGTGPMPQLSQTMMPPSDTIWWTRPPAQGSGQAQGQA